MFSHRNVICEYKEWSRLPLSVTVGSMEALNARSDVCERAIPIVRPGGSHLPFLVVPILVVAT